VDDLRTICWDAAINAFGTQKIFEHRAKLYDSWLKCFTLLGIAVPVLLGVDLLHGIPVVRTLSDWSALLLCIFAIFTLVYDWPGRLAFARESAGKNAQLASRYEALGRNPPSSVEEMQKRLHALEAETVDRDEADTRYLLWGWEFRFGMRSALRQFGRPCHGCGVAPTTMKSSKCSICGQFGIIDRLPGRHTRL
jgi:mobilome CxxCx(11)CxxC protein